MGDAMRCGGPQNSKMGKSPQTQTQKQDGGGGVLGPAVAAVGMGKVLRGERERQAWTHLAACSGKRCLLSQQWLC